MKKAFTLIELLVVIAIISFLAAAVIFGLNGAKVRARDEARIRDLAQIKTAMELYFPEQNPNAYKISATPVTASPASTGLTSSFLKVFPTDPIESSSKPYLYVATDKDYAIFAALEDSKNPSKKTTDPRVGPMPSGYNYWVQND